MTLESIEKELLSVYPKAEICTTMSGLNIKIKHVEFTICKTYTGMGIMVEDAYTPYYQRETYTARNDMDAVFYLLNRAGVKIKLILIEE